jgi:ribonuclease HI
MAWDEDDKYWPHKYAGGPPASGGWRPGASPKPPAAPAHPLYADALYSDCSLRINPGIAEVRVVDWKKKIIWAFKTTRSITNNAAELVGVCKGLELAPGLGKKYVFTDSQVVHGWITRQGPKRLRQDREKVEALIRAARARIKKCGLQVRLWNTQAHGQIPADYGRKNH